MSIRNVPVIGKVLLVLAAFAAVSIASNVFLTGKMREIAAGFQSAIDDQGTTALYLARANRALNGAHAAIADLLVISDEAGAAAKALTGLETQRAGFVKFMDKADAADVGNVLDISSLKVRGLDIIDNVCQAAVSLGRGASDPAAAAAAQKQYARTCEAAFAPAADAVTSLVDRAVTRQEDIKAELASDTHDSIVLAYVTLFASVCLVLVGSFFVIRGWVSRPLNHLTETMKRLAGGDLGAMIPGAEYRDELGLMARSVQVFKDNALQLQAAEAEAERLRAATERDRAGSEAERAKSAARQEAVVRSIAGALGQLSSGDLTFRIHEPFPAEYEGLRTDFNGAMAKLQETMVVVSTNASAIRTGTDEISTAAEDLSRRTEQQAASLEETAAALDEITATVRKTAEGSSLARQVVGSAKQDAERSGVVVRQAVEAMNGIEKSAGQINQIIGVIDEIAFQTNLLALNAGVEAARAGEAGRGFAVVASEVRALAQRSADAAKEIKQLISASGHHVALGVDLVAETGKSLERIVAKVAEINSIVGEIAASAQEQATGLNQVNTAVNQMDQVTQQNAAMVEQSTAASQTLAQETRQLAILIGGFKLGDQPGRTPGQPVQVGARRPKAAVTAIALKTVGNGGAARKPEPANQDWEEF